MGDYDKVTHHATYVDLHARRSTLDELPEPPAWMAGALCAQTDPDMFFPDKGGSTVQAKAVCASCTVRQECLEYALSQDERFGIWGGTSERERRKMKAGPGAGRLPESVWLLRKAEVTRLHAAGLLDTEIAKQLGLPRETVGRVRRGLRLKNNKDFVPKLGRGGPRA